jgi:hypothetical protein
MAESLRKFPARLDVVPCRVPELIMEFPLYVFIPERMRVPFPTFANPLDPANSAEMVAFTPDPVLMVLSVALAPPSVIVPLLIV